MVKTCRYNNLPVCIVLIAGICWTVCFPRRNILPQAPSCKVCLSTACYPDDFAELFQLRYCTYFQIQPCAQGLFSPGEERAWNLVPRVSLLQMTGRRVRPQTKTSHIFTQRMSRNQRSTHSHAVWLSLPVEYCKAHLSTPT